MKDIDLAKIKETIDLYESILGMNEFDSPMDLLMLRVAIDESEDVIKRNGSEDELFLCLNSLNLEIRKIMDQTKVYSKGGKALLGEAIAKVLELIDAIKLKKV